MENATRLPDEASEKAALKRDHGTNRTDGALSGEELLRVTGGAEGAAQPAPREAEYTSWKITRF